MTLFIKVIKSGQPIFVDSKQRLLLTFIGCTRNAGKKNGTLQLMGRLATFIIDNKWGRSMDSCGQVLGL